MSHILFLTWYVHFYLFTGIAVQYCCNIKLMIFVGPCFHAHSQQDFPPSLQKKILYDRLPLPNCHLLLGDEDWHEVVSRAPLMVETNS